MYDERPYNEVILIIRSIVGKMLFRRQKRTAKKLSHLIMAPIPFLHATERLTDVSYWSVPFYLVTCPSHGWYPSLCH